MKKYLVVGAGLFGSTFAYEAALRGYPVHIIEKKDHIAGHIYTEEIHGIQVHRYGAHIFHTKNKKIWKYINQFADFNRYTHQPIAKYKGRIYNLPFNMNTFYEMWGITTPEEAKLIIEQQKTNFIKNNDPQNLEEQAISLVGTDIYYKLIKGYTEKQWGKSATKLPPFIIKRLPVRYVYNNNYFNDNYQGIPIEGYTQIVSNMLSSPLIHLELNTDFYENKDYYLKNYDRIIFTGMIDKFFDYKLGTLEYRGLYFKSKYLNISNYQGNSVVNYTDKDVPFTRIIEHKHFVPNNKNYDLNKTIITYEYPKHWNKNDEPYYPVNDLKNNLLYKKYYNLAKIEYPQITFGGRLGQYRYYNMDQVIAAALQLVDREF